MVRRMFDEHGNGPVPASQGDERATDQAMLDVWSNTINAAQQSAPRFQLDAGQALLIDNYRMFHGREGYSDPQRMMWRVWVWTQAALGVPGIELHSDSRFTDASAG